MLELFQAAPKPFPICGNVIEGAQGCDVRLCRRKALEDTEDIPKFGLLDKWEKYDPEKEYDLYYVDAGPLTNVFFQLPYRGPGIYWKVAWRELEEEVRDKTEWATVASEHKKRGGVQKRGVSGGVAQHLGSLGCGLGGGGLLLRGRLLLAGTLDLLSFQRSLLGLFFCLEFLLGHALHLCQPLLL